jgi:hypothetical protein
MEPISYRASSAFYAQWEQFVVFDANDQGLLSYLHEGNEAELGNFIATKYGFGVDPHSLIWAYREKLWCRPQ